MLVALQIALTLAVIANAGSVIRGHWIDMSRPSGLDEANVFSMSNQWVGQPDDLSARIKADTAALRALPGVVDAEATNSFPLSGWTWWSGASLKPNQANPSARTSLYVDTAHGLAAQGLKLVAGRWFLPAEVSEIKPGEMKSGPSAVLTAALAKRLFPDGQALGRSVYVAADDPERIVGIVERASSGSGTGMDYVEFSTFLSGQMVSSQLLYVVRAEAGQQQSVMRAARQRLLELSRMRILGEAEPFSKLAEQTVRGGGRNQLAAGDCVHSHAGHHGLRNGRVDHAVGGAATPADRYAAGARRAAHRHPELFPSREPDDLGYRCAGGYRRWIGRQSVVGQPCGDDAHEPGVYRRRRSCGGVP